MSESLLDFDTMGGFYNSSGIKIHNTYHLFRVHTGMLSGMRCDEVALSGCERLEKQGQRRRDDSSFFSDGQ